jgi:hypothetical protein
MKRSTSLSAALAALLTLAAGPPAWAGPYHSADFADHLNSAPNIWSPFSGVLHTGGGITGNFVFDDNLVPAARSGFVDVSFSSFPDIAHIPGATAFRINLGGGIDLTLTDAVMGQAAIQYKHGHFNGFFFEGNFTFHGHPYDLEIRGSVFDITAADAGTGFPTGQKLVNGALNIGNQDLTNFHLFTPPLLTAAPEPASLTLLGLGSLGLLGYNWRRRNPAAA